MKQLKISLLILVLATYNCMLAQNTPVSGDKAKPSPFALQLKMSPPVSLLLTNVRSDTYDNEEKGFLGFNIGADFMYYYLNKDKFRASISLGVGYTNYRTSRNLSFEHSIWTTDADEDDVLVTEIVDNLNEKQSFRFLDIPLKLGFEYALSDILDAYISFGATYGFSLNGKYNSQAIVTRNGYYPDFNVLLFDIDVGGSPYFYPTNKIMKTNDAIDQNTNISFEGTLGMKLELNSKFSVLFGVKYMLGVKDIVDENNRFIVRHNDELDDYSLNSLSGRGDVIKTSAMGLELGVQYNIWKIFK